MAVVKNLMVRAGADFSAITKQSNKAKASMKGMQTSVSKSCSLMTSAASGMKKAFAAMGAVLSVSAVVSFGKEAKAAYDEQAEASAKLAQVMRNTMGVRADEVKSIEDFIDAQERLGVVTGDIQTEGAQELATYLTLSSSLKTLIPVMNDMVAQQYGLSASAESAVSIATMLGKVMNGQTSALSRYGYSFTAAQEAVLKYGTEAERAAVLAEVVSESVGGMNAALAATPNGRLKQVSNTLGKIQETFGQAINHVLVLFIPALNVLCNMLANVATLANKLAQTLANVFGSGASKAAATVSYTGAVSEAVSELESAAESAGEAMGALGFDQMTKLPSSSEAAESESAGNPVGRITESTDGTEEAGESIGWLEARLTALQEKFASFDTSKLTGAFDRLKEAAAPLTQGLFSGRSWAMDNVLVPLAGWTVESGLPAFLDTLSVSAANISPALESLQTAVQPLVAEAFAGLQWAYENVFIPFASWAGGELLPGFLDLLTEALSGLNAIWTEVKPGLEWLWSNFLQPVAEWTGGVILDVLGKLSDELKRFGDWCKDNHKAIEDIGLVVGAFAAAWVLVNGAMTVWNTIGAVGAVVTGGFGAAVSVLTSPITIVTLAIGALIAAVILLVRHWDTVKEVAGKVWSGIKSVWSSVSTWFSENVINPISNGFKSLANGVLGFFEGIANGAISAVNKLIGALNKISFDIPDWVPIIGGKKFGFNLKEVAKVTLPRLATGAVIPPNNEFMAILGDQTSGNNIEAPESLIRKIVREESGGKNKSNPTKIVIPVYVGGRKITEKVIEDINDLTRTTGECPIMI